MPRHTLAAAASATCLSLALLTQTAMAQESPAPQLITYPAPDALKYTRHNDDYTVRVRTPGGSWQDVFEWSALVDLDNPQAASLVSFDTAGPVEVWIRKNNGDVRSVRVRPDRTGIKAKVHGNVATFTLSGPTKLSVEFNDDRLHNLHLFANPIETPPDPKDPNVIWFGPGVHKPGDLPGIAFNILPGKTVYIDGAAVLQGKLVVSNADNVRIIGHGIIDMPERGVEVTFSKHVVIDGPIVLNPAHYSVYCGQASDIEIHNFKAISAREWSDGLDFMSCSDVKIDDVFLRNSDDNIAIYGKRWNFAGDVRNFRVSNAILWADKAHPINIGTHGDTDGPGEVIEDLKFSDIDILEHDEVDPNYQGAIAISDGDSNLVQHVEFNTVWVDDFQEGRLLNFKVMFNGKYNTAPGRGIHDVVVRDLTYQGENLMPSVIQGYSPDHGVTDVRFENLVINGKAISSPKDGNIEVGPNVSGVTFATSKKAR